MIVPPRRNPGEKIGTGKALLGGLAGLLCLALGIGLIAAAIHECWLVSSLHGRGLQAQADVYLDGVVDEHHQIAFDHYTTKAVSYSYSFRVQGQAYQGSASSSNDEFMEALQKEDRGKGRSLWPGPVRVGTVAVTYLPADPAWHRFGRVDESRVAAARGALWWGIPMGLVFTLAGGLAVLGCYFLMFDKPTDLPGASG